MSSSFTTNKQLEKQATGENENTWGALLNATLDLIDKATAGKLTKSVAGSSDVTLTAAEACNIIHEYSGALTGNISVIVPSTTGPYFIYNNTSGSYTLTVKTSGGTGIAVTQGKRRILFCDGINVVDAVDAVEESSTASGDVVGPASATDDHVVLFDGATGKLIKSAGVALSSKANVSDLADVATSGDYADLANAPVLADVATSGSYNDLTDLPTDSGGLLAGTAVATTSGSSIVVSGIPSGVNFISVALNEVSRTSAATTMDFRIGDSGGTENTGYAGNIAQNVGGTFTFEAITTAMRLCKSDGSVSDTAKLIGFVTCQRVSGNTWVMTFSGGAVTGNVAITAFSAKTLSAELDQIELLVSAGSFDYGSINIVYS